LGLRRGRGTLEALIGGGGRGARRRGERFCEGTEHKGQGKPTKYLLKGPVARPLERCEKKRGTERGLRRGIPNLKKKKE